MKISLEQARTATSKAWCIKDRLQTDLGRLAFLAAPSVTHLGFID